MEEDRFALVKKIIKDIHNVLTKTPELYSFDIIPMENNYQNKSPVLVLENCLGLESWCVKHVYLYCYSELTDICSIKCNQKQRKVSLANSDQIIQLLNVSLLLNPEISSFWNKRRELVHLSILEKCRELQFTRLILSRKPKCNDAFAYRRWLLDNLFQDENFPTCNRENIINDELNICQLASDKSPNNYHSWSHRMWLMKILNNLKKYFDTSSLYIKEYSFSEKWMSKHISDHSCFHYRQFCIKNIFNLSTNMWTVLEDSLNMKLRKVLVKVLASNFPKDVTIQVSEENLIAYSEQNLINLLFAYTNKNCNCTLDFVSVCRKLEILVHELVLSNELICFYTHHETLWYHRRFILHEMIEIMYNHFELVKHNGALIKKTCKTCNFIDLRQKQAKIVRYDNNGVSSCVLFNVILSHEKQFIEERRNIGDNYADRHEKYLRYVEGFNGVM